MAVHLFLKVDGGGTILLILNLFIAVCPYLQIQWMNWTLDEWIVSLLTIENVVQFSGRWK